MRKIVDEYDYLIHLVRCTIHDEKPEEIPKGLSFNNVYQYAVLHDIANISFYSIEKLDVKPEEELYNKWREKCNLAITRDINQSFAHDEIIEEFNISGIRSVEVQGTRVKKIYPRSEYRTMSDIDFIIDLDNLDKAKDVLEKLGYNCKYIDGVEVDGYRAPNIIIELHTEFFPKESRFCGYMDEPFDNLTESNDGICEANNDVFYLYSILHIAKHYFLRGCGIRRILDVYFLNKVFLSSIDQDYVSPRFEAAGISEFVKDISELADCWFGNGELNEKLYEMERHIKESELHGSNNGVVYNSLNNEKKQGKHFVKLRFILRRIFPDKETMYECYPFLKTHRFLLPFYRAYRIIRLIFTKRKKRVFSELKLILNSTFNKDY